MIIEVKETNYKGILVQRIDDRGWMCNLGGQEYLFPTYVAAQSAIDEIFRAVKPIINKNRGKKYYENPSDIPPHETERESLVKKYFDLLYAEPKASRDEILSVIDAIDAIDEAHPD